MELKCTNPTGEIVLASKLNYVELIFRKNCKNCIQKWILQVIFSKRYLDCPKNKIIHNFHITYSNGINQSFPYRQKYNLWEFFCFFWLKFKIKIFFAARFPLFWAYFGITFVPRQQIGKKLYSHEAIHFTYLEKKFQKIRTKQSKLETVGTYPNPICPPKGQWSFRG